MARVVVAEDLWFVCFWGLFARVGYPTLDVILSLDNLLLHILSLRNVGEVGNDGHEMVLADADKSAVEALGVEFLNTFDGHLLVAIAAYDYVVPLGEGLCYKWACLLLFYGRDYGGRRLVFYGVSGRWLRLRDRNLDRLFLAEEVFVYGIVLVEIDDETGDEQEEQDNQCDNERLLAFLFLVIV